MWNHLRDVFIVALLLPLSAIASPVPAQNWPASSDFEVIVIGGGPAGLSALSGLARVRRRALLIDSGEYRNGLTRHAHDIIGLDGLSTRYPWLEKILLISGTFLPSGVTPAYLRAKAREQISRYPTVSMQNGTVVDINVVNGTSFTITDDSGHVYTSQKVVLATGIKDLVPSTPGLLENWSKGIFWCPWCDGYEHRDQPMGLLSTIDKIPGMVEEIRTLNTDLIAFVNGSMTTDAIRTLNGTVPEWQKMLATYNVQVDNRTITSIERIQDGAVVASDVDMAEYDKFMIHLDDGTAVERGACFTSFPSTQRSGLGASLGVTMVQEKLYSNMTLGMRTNISGVYAVGDANSDGSTNVPHAMWSGKRAAVDIHSESPFQPPSEYFMGASEELTGRATVTMGKAEAAAAVAGSKSKRAFDVEDEESLLALIGRDLEDLWSAK
ncbi:uncharacterized protein A1O9_01614 [Exophiala aquamarina CBS 119918]|uniref:FAD/NAD(P)-binding domain-containing protein n=1 Tax=Exophiala aquamarina CBS 119918 TaxID=1182545 RepID=A0A072PUU8_9EURO|nr:uncharacterized protein A1O9_01614 [Exophiala aquamarina CBS 119918]KEF63636.1 hypothetical protein A1O9_01614 [Exophiala aquamarina CBS 119918]